MAIELPTEPSDEEVSALTGSIRYESLTRRHPEYYDDFWCRARALYKGGIHLLEDDRVMRKVFPQQVGENDKVYEMRKQMAHYTNHSGAIVNHLLGKLMTDPVRIQAKPEPDTFYNDWLEDCSAPDGHEVSINDLIEKLMLTAAQCQTAYALVEMPNNLDSEAKSLAEQEKNGDLKAWCVEVAPESVVDWEVDKAGEFLWVLLCFKTSRRESLFDARDTIHEEYWLYTKEGWIRWDVRYRKGDTPNKKDVVTPTDMGAHTFGKVPLAKLCLPDGLWIMSKLESLAREYLNKRNALSWAEFKALLPVLYEFIDPGHLPALSGPGGSPDKAVNQKRSPAHVQERQAAAGQGDSAEWIGPPDGPFGHALTSCDSIRDEMHRVVQQMALSADNKGAMLRRSEGSKKEDSSALDVVLGAYGRIARKFLIGLLQLVEAGRGDKNRVWTASGLNTFKNDTSEGVVAEEVELDTVEMPSSTFKAERKKQVVRVLLGDSVSEEKLAEIDKEIDSFYAEEDQTIEAELTRESVRADLEEAKRRQNPDENDEDDELSDVLEGSRKSGKNRMVVSTFKGSKA